MSRDDAIANAHAYFDDGGFVDEMARRVAFRTESHVPEQKPELYRYLSEDIGPAFEKMGFETAVLENPVSHGGPVLYAGRIEGDGLPTVLTYGHGDVTRGIPEEWSEGLDPWTATRKGDLLYGRGMADNKGQHTINMAALDAVLKARGKLGFNCKMMLEMSEEPGSPGLPEVAEAHKDLFAADVLIASDGPRLTPNRAALTLGSRGSYIFTLTLNLREGGVHSGHYGGLIRNPGITLAHALASFTTPSEQILVDALKPSRIPNSVRAALADCVVEPGGDAPEPDPAIGEPGLTPAERLYGWSSFNILAFVCGNPENPVNAVPPSAKATCQMRFTVDTDHREFLGAIRKHLDDHDFGMIAVEWDEEHFFPATRSDVDDPWVVWAAQSLERTAGEKPHICPNASGGLPTQVFLDILGMPSIFVPHSYGGCKQHGPNEHLLLSVSRDALGLMAGLFWDLGEPGTPGR
jgi:acetylornithine deacetylase/succinyl-diaminopimelate desuccinylase-like protein